MLITLVVNVVVEVPDNTPNLKDLAVAFVIADAQVHAKRNLIAKSSVKGYYTDRVLDQNLHEIASCKVHGNEV
jgi:hypothetical protein